MKVLGIETSCDDTSCAVLDGETLLSNIISSQWRVHEKFGGVVPELASRQHMEAIVPVVDEALEQAHVLLKDIEGIAVTKSPGLTGSLLVGLSFAKSLSFAIGKPFVGVNHLEAHLHAVFLEKSSPTYPFIGLVVSGGHTSLYHVKALGDYTLIGATRDDAVGEVYDKIAKLMNVGYPGGPIIDRLAQQGEPKRVPFTRPKIGTGSKYQIGEADFSFSGIKTAMRLKLEELHYPNCDKELWHHLLASFQDTVTSILIDAIERACLQEGLNHFVISGGVACNSALRKKAEELATKNGWRHFIPRPALCTDNAAMVAYVGSRYLEMGKRDNHGLVPTAVDELGLKR